MRGGPDFRGRTGHMRTVPRPPYLVLAVAGSFAGMLIRIADASALVITACRMCLAAAPALFQVLLSKLI